MKISVFIRPLSVYDARISYKWRNDKTVWEFTGFRASTPVTLQMEEQWLSSVLRLHDQCRFGICITDGAKYIGNVSLTDIAGGKAQLHLVIGDKEYWGRGIGRDASWLMVMHGFEKLALHEIYLRVMATHHRAIAIYTSLGFSVTGETEGLLIMSINSARFKEKLNEQNYGQIINACR